MTETMIDSAELTAAQAEAADLRKQLAALRAEHDRMRLTSDIARHLCEKLEPVAAFDAAGALAARVERSSTGRLVIDADGVLADDVGELVKQYLTGRGRYLLESRAARTRSDDSAAGSSKVFDPAQLTDPHYAKKWKEADPEGFAVAWKKHLAEIAARPVGQR
jgi:hypothetical protein